MFAAKLLAITTLAIAALGAAPLASAVTYPPGPGKASGADVAAAGDVDPGGGGETADFPPGPGKREH
jgi:hypothetical protein